jgi:hypothetical protein
MRPVRPDDEHLREERALARALASAPTAESAHEIAALVTRR